MPSLLRVANKRRWDWPSSEFEWVPTGAIPAAPFGDLAPSSASALSVWLIEDDESNLDRIVAALAAGRKHLDKFDYALIADRALQEIGIRIEQKAEPCPDPDASARWHHNMVRLTAADLNALVELVHSRGQLKRMLKPQVESILKTAVAGGRLDLSRIEKSLLDAIAPASTASNLSAAGGARVYSPDVEIETRSAGFRSNARPPRIASISSLITRTIGSLGSMKRGLSAIARAAATRWRWPR